MGSHSPFATFLHGSGDLKASSFPDAHVSETASSAYLLSTWSRLISRRMHACAAVRSCSEPYRRTVCAYLSAWCVQYVSAAAVSDTRVPGSPGNACGAARQRIARPLELNSGTSARWSLARHTHISGRGSISPAAAASLHARNRSTAAAVAKLRCQHRTALRQHGVIFGEVRQWCASNIVSGHITAHICDGNGPRVMQPLEVCV